AIRYGEAPRKALEARAPAGKRHFGQAQQVRGSLEPRETLPDPAHVEAAEPTVAHVEAPFAAEGSHQLQLAGACRGQVEGIVEGAVDDRHVARREQRLRDAGAVDGQPRLYLRYRVGFGGGDPAGHGERAV